MGDSYGAAIVEHLSRDDLLLTDFESRAPKDEQQPLYPLGTRYTPRSSDVNGIPARALDDDNANELLDKGKYFDENISSDKPRLTETTF